MSFLKVLFHSQKGFSLPEVMVAVGVSAVVGMAASKMMTDNYKNQSYLETMAEIKKTMALAQNALANRTNCNETLSGFSNTTTFPQNITGIKTRQTFNTPTDFTDDVVTDIIKVDDYRKYAITSMTVRESTKSPQIKDVVINFSWKNRQFMAPSSIVKTVSIFAELDPVTNKWMCGGVIRDSKEDSQRALCDALGIEFAEWDTVAAKCVIKEFRCNPGFVPRQITSLGQVACVPTETTIDLNNLIDPTTVPCPATEPNIRIEFDSGINKYRLLCGGGGGSGGSSGGSAGGSSAGGSSGGTSGGSSGGTSGGPCTPVSTCAALVANACPSVSVTDSCGTSCGMGTSPFCCADQTCPPGKTKVYSNTATFMTLHCGNTPGANCQSSLQGHSTCSEGGLAPYSICTSVPVSHPGLVSCTSSILGTYYAEVSTVYCTYP